MSKGKIALLILALLVVAIIAALVVVDSKFAILRSSPKVSYATLESPNTRAIAVVNVPMTKDIIYSKFLKNTQIPASVLPLVLPNEAALLIGVDKQAGNLGFSMFINDKRLSPIILDQVNAAKLPVPLDKIFTGKMERKQPGVLVREGSLNVDKAILDNLATQWANANVSAPLKVDGSHLVELVLDNRDGGTVALIAGIAAMQGLDISSYLTEGRLGVIAAIGSIRAQTDVLPDGNLKLHLVIDGVEGGDPSMMGVLQFGVEMGYGQAKALAATKGLVIEGASVAKGNTIEGDYTINNLDKILAML